MLFLVTFISALCVCNSCCIGEVAHCAVARQPRTPGRGGRPFV